jgi:hypothetical protein
MSITSHGQIEQVGSLHPETLFYSGSVLSSSTSRDVVSSREWAIAPETLYHAGLVDLESVQFYIGQLIRGLAIYTPKHSISEAGTDSGLDIRRWRDEDPVDFAISSFYEYGEKKGTECQYVPVSEPIYSDHLAQLDLKHEMDAFFDYKKEYQKTSFKFVQRALEQMGPSSTDVEGLKCVVAMPVAGHQEYGNIFHTLEQFTKQDLPSGEFELVLYLNRPGFLDNENDATIAANFKRTLDEVARFKEAYPNVNVRSITNTYLGKPPLIGKIRADLCDVVAADMKSRGRNKDILVVGADADTVHMNSRYLSEMATTFYGSKSDIVTANLRYQSIPNLPYDAMANRMLRYLTFLDSLCDNYRNWLHTSDGVTGVSLAAYLAVGGFNRECDLGETNDLVDRILCCRQGEDEPTETGIYVRYVHAKEVESKAKGAYLKTNPRRHVLAMALGHPPHLAWDKDLIPFGSDDEVRTEEIQGHAAEAAALAHYREWDTVMTKSFTGDIYIPEGYRILSVARKILSLSS